MKKIKILIVCMCISILPVSASAFSFGADVAVLTQILAKAVLQLEQLRQMLQTAQNQRDLLRQVNEGLEQTVRMIQLIDPNFDPGIYKDWKDFHQAARALERLYGDLSNPDALLRDIDRNVAEAIVSGNSLFKYSKQTEGFAENMHHKSVRATPKSAARLSAQSLGVVVGQQSQLLRNSATQSKLQAQSLAARNSKNKAQAKQVRGASSHLSNALKNYDPKFEIPRL